MSVNKQLIRELGIAFAGAAVGTGTTYLVIKKRFQVKADREIEEVRETYRLLRKEGELATPETAVEHLEDLREKAEEVNEEIAEYKEGLKDLQYVGEITPQDLEDAGHTPAVVPTVHLQFPEDDEDEDLPVLEEPDDDKPYLIRIHQFHEDYDRHEKQSITYYAKDATLVDESDEPIHDIARVIGTTALDNFGNGSRDPDIVYVRNHKISTDFEVIRSPNAYTEDVLGVDPRHEGAIRRAGYDE